LPPIEEDPVAIALGFVTPSVHEPTILVAGPKVKKLRMRRSLNARQLVEAAAKLGGSLGLQDLVRLERQPLDERLASDVTALADALQCSVRDLSGDPDNLDPFVSFLYSDAFEAEVAQWCKSTHQDAASLRVDARHRMLVGQRRSTGRGDVEDWMDLLRAVLDSLR
jgi:hypothetical protein